jgi:hypothetical protein
MVKFPQTAAAVHPGQKPEVRAIIMKMPDGLRSENRQNDQRVEGCNSSWREQARKESNTLPDSIKDLGLQSLRLELDTRSVHETSTD